MSERLHSDQLAGSPHPRETTQLYGQEHAEQTLLTAYLSARIHHAWIFAGLEGIGKATLAYRMARFVLANPDPAQIPGANNLSVPVDHPVSRQVMAMSHVDLTVLRRLPNEKTKGFYSNIRVDDVRNAVRFFSTTAGGGGWRIAIIDCAEDLAREGANALLKVLEEPPPKVLFLIVSHQPARLLPTIRSRCRTLSFAPLSQENVLAAAIHARPDLDRNILGEAARLAGGSVRRALVLADGDGVELHKALMAILSRLPALDIAAAHSLADLCINKAGEENFTLLLDFLEEWLHRQVFDRRNTDVAHLAQWAEIWEKIRNAAREVEIYNLDRKPFILSSLSMLAANSGTVHV